MNLNKSTLIQLLKEKAISPRRSLGQNFMIDPNFLRYIIKTAEVNPDDYILEIGSGTGALTGFLTEQAKQVYSVEIDERLSRLAGDLLGTRPNLEIINKDILDAGRQKLNPSVEKHLLSEVAPAGRRGRETFGAGSATGRSPSELMKIPVLKIVSNLPYASAIPIIISLLESPLPISRMFLVVQLEIAQRLTAQPGTKEYGSYTVLVQTLSGIKLLRKIPPEVFWPKPKVFSALIEITPQKQSNLSSGEYLRLKETLKLLFQHRRKMVGSAYRSFNLSRGEWFDSLTRSGISPQQRPEQISRECFIKLVKNMNHG
ncbi:MAG: rRNA adenine dimethyltransferase family protein [Planctomycetota bacterium]